VPRTGSPGVPPRDYATIKMARSAGASDASLGPPRCHTTVCLITSHRCLGKPGGIQEPFCTAVTAEPHAPMTMDRSAPRPSVGRLSGRNGAQHRDVTPTNVRVLPLVGAVLGAVIRSPLDLPEDVANLMERALTLRQISGMPASKTAALG
jgi:hypothetical protein